jgi:ATP/ADP translocase
VLLLREPLFITDILGILLICIGSTMFLLSAKNGEEIKSSDELRWIYMRPLSIIFYSCSLLFLMLSLSLEKCIKVKIMNYYNERRNPFENHALRHLVQAILLFKPSEEC